jgi:hypothetical protein
MLDVWELQIKQNEQVKNNRYPLSFSLCLSLCLSLSVSLSLSLSPTHSLLAGCWTGRRLLFFYQLGLIGTIVAVFYLASRMLMMTRSFEATYNTLGTDDETFDFDYYEESISTRFNQFYFSSIQTCTDSKYAFFWGFINDHCPQEMGLLNCMKCEDYSITSCPADEQTCFSDSPYSHQACAYNLCRGPILDYVIAYSRYAPHSTFFNSLFFIRPLSEYLVFFGVFQLGLLFLNCLLICYTEKDSVEEMLIKSGTIGNGREHQGPQDSPKRRPKKKERDIEEGKSESRSGERESRHSSHSRQSHESKRGDRHESKRGERDNRSVDSRSRQGERDNRQRESNGRPATQNPSNTRK